MKFRAVALAIAAIVVAPDAASAQEDAQWVYRIIRKQYRQCDDFWGTCRMVWRDERVRVPAYDYGYAPRRYAEPRAYGYASAGRAPDQCKGKIIEASGFEYASVEKALKSAQLVYSSSVRQEFGEVFQSIENATDVKVLCHDASVNDTAIGKLGEALIGDAAILKRCKIWARPCRSSIEPTTFADPKSERGQIEEEKLERRGYVPERPQTRLERWRQRFRRPVRGE